MQRKTKLALAAAASTSALGALLLVPGQLALSADHLDPPTLTNPANTANPDLACDIADDYAFHDANFVYIAHTFGGPAATDRPAFYDRNVMHTIMISTSPPATSSDVSIRFRFGPGANSGEHGILLENLPGVNGNLVGPVEQILSRDGVRVYAGLRDDPFFFDNVGLNLSRQTGVLQFTSNPSRSSFFARNITAVVLEIPRSRLGPGPLDISSTCGRIQGTTP
ncbi:MAG: DUF4331 domain-containing protein [Novosphingobium sp.]|nr:DUF4331 domain-containing protein [Novosphingobium sp.]